MHITEQAEAFNAGGRIGAQPAAADLEATLSRLGALARVLDNAVRLPGTDIRIGVDALIGLVPVVGDLVSKTISSYLIYEAHRLGASRWVLARMAANTTVDAVVGSIPVLGDAFDVLYRANDRNLRLLRGHIEARCGHGHRFPDGGLTIDGRATEIHRS